MFVRRTPGGFMFSFTERQLANTGHSHTAIRIRHFRTVPVMASRMCSLLPCSKFTCSVLASGQNWGTRIRTLRKVAFAGSKTPFDTENCNLAAGPDGLELPPARGRAGHVRGCRGVESPPQHLPASFWRMTQSAKGRRELRALAACWDGLTADGRRALLSVGRSLRKGGRHG